MKRTLLLPVVLALFGCDGASSVVTARTPNGSPANELPGNETVVDPPQGDPSAPDACADVKVAASTTALRPLNLEGQRNGFRDVPGDATHPPDLAHFTTGIITEAEVEKLNL